MKKLGAAVLVFILVQATVFAETETIYLDKPTPPGSTAPLDPMKNQGQNRSPADTYRGLNPVTVQPIPSRTSEDAKNNDSMVQAFSKAYRKAKSPRMTLFMNRYLSDEIQEWSSNSRFAATKSGSLKLVDGSAAAYKRNGFISPASYSLAGESSGLDMEVADGTLVVTTQTKNDLAGSRSPIIEENMWRIENGFMNGFLNAGANIVDRATIIRLMAMRYNSNNTVDLPEKNIEMSALSYYSDIYIEMLVKRTRGGYVFKTVAKEIKTGRILAVAGSDDAYKKLGNQNQATEYVATDQGFQPKGPELKTIEDVAYDLGLCLMSSLVRTWERP